MVRHRSIHDGDAVSEFLLRHRPRHVYHSTARYDDPGAESMGAKGWRGADLVFDLDADHLPEVDADRDPYPIMLERCRDATVELVDMLTGDFGFDDLTVIFSGNRGYHVHVRDSDVLDLGQSARREVVEYVRGEGLSFDALVRQAPIPGTEDTKRRLDTSGGWGARIRDRLVATLDGLREHPRDERVETLEALDGIGPSRADSVARLIDTRWSAIERGEIDLHPDYLHFVRAFVEQRVAGSGPAIDDPVTTDVHRLIRLPGSLHGKTGFVVRPIPPDDLATFDPLESAIPSMFRTTGIAIDLEADHRTELAGETFQLAAGRRRVPEFVGIYLMARGVAEKARE